jgi:hypothetical protein
MGAIGREFSVVMRFSFQKGGGKGFSEKMVHTVDSYFYEKG